LDVRVRTFKKVPGCIRGHFTRILTQSLVAVASARGNDETAEVRAWKLLFLLPRLILHTSRRGGEAGERELKNRIELFDAGRDDTVYQQRQ
ncbi:MAG: hypothetical protein OSB45_15020, partial [Pseudomonadales bacterium]|nr:hypothetical protein [Pseudomonadales bacterium]